MGGRQDHDVPMKNVFLLLLTAGLLASCAPKNEGATTTTTETTTTTTDTSGTTGTDTAGTDTADTATTDMADTTGTTTTETTTTTTETGDMKMGAVKDFDGTGRTFHIEEGGKDYMVNVTDATVWEGTATTADDFFGTDRNGANVSVEGTMNGDTIEATKITTN